jgi:hypothetical protein
MPLIKDYGEYHDHAESDRGAGRRPQKEADAASPVSDQATAGPEEGANDHIYE